MMGAAMPAINQTFNYAGSTWLAAMIATFWQSALLILLAVVVAWLLRRSSPVVRYWLWQIVAIKLLLMPFWTSYVPLPSWINRPVAQSAKLQSMPGQVEEPNPPAFRYPSGLAEGVGGQMASSAASFWEPFRSVTWQAWLMAAWFAVVVFQILRLVAQRRRLASLLRHGAAADEGLARLVVELAGAIGLRRMPAAVTVATDCPLFVCGLWRPRLVLPSRLMASLDEARRRQVILHELAHVKRHDLPWGWPVEIARMVYFFHPLVYWAAYRLRLERELCCDQLAMARSGQKPADYAQTLVEVVSHASEPAAVQAAAIDAGLAGAAIASGAAAFAGRRPIDSPSPGQRPGETGD
jgi:beta-lactamase regulating signal transducer with metallopeptidase domain